MLSVKSLDSYYGRAHVLQGVSFALAAGEYWCCSAGTAQARARR